MNNQKMTRRRPGDYVVNSELTQQQIQRFVGDCVEAGAMVRRDVYDGEVVILTRPTGLYVGSARDGRERSNRNVTHEYKDQPTTKTPDLPTVLEECAEHLRAGRDPCEYFEIVSGFGNVKSALSVDYMLSCAIKGRIRRRIKHKTPTEDDVGRLVMVRDHEQDEWLGPIMLIDVRSGPYPFLSEMAGGWNYAKLYQGPTRPNWIDYDGQGLPEDVHKAGGALVQDRDGGIRYIGVFNSGWSIKEGVGTIIRYTIIEP